MLGISRWTEKGGSYRTVQRFFNSQIVWLRVMWVFFRHHLYRSGDEYIMAGDETVVSKSGKKTHGLDRFFSSLASKPVPGLAFFALSLINVRERTSSPILVEQRIRSEAEKAAAKSKKNVKKQKRKKPGKPGRPKGSKNKDKTQIEWNPELRMIDGMIRRVLSLINGLFPITYLVLDGHFGNNNALQMVLNTSLHLISKLRHDSALYFRYDGEQKKHGKDKVYGDKIDYDNIPAQHRKLTTVDKGFRTEIYQAEMLHHAFAQPLNVVIIVKTNLQSGARAHVVLFSSDLSLAYDQLINYYRLRFQIEFNFRDAKQFWGLEDFMNVNQTPVNNFVNLSLFMVLVSQRLLRDFRRQTPAFGILDLKTYFRGRKYAALTLELLAEKPEPFLFQRILDTIASFGSIHRRRPPTIAS